MNLHYIASVWNYSRLCCLSLSQFVLHPPRNHTATVTVCYCREADPRTAAVLDYFSANHSPPNVVWDWRNFERRRLMRRAISRNEVARSTTADFVIFADIDYMPAGFGVLDATIEAMAAATDGGKRRLMHPRYICQSVSHESGDREIERVLKPGIYRLEEEYPAVPLPRAIGGFQGVTGDTARELGYLPHSVRFQRPAGMWQRTFCDKAYRDYLASNGVLQVALEINGWHRVRHGKRGRFDIDCRL